MSAKLAKSPASSAALTAANDNFYLRLVCDTPRPPSRFEYFNAFCMAFLALLLIGFAYLVASNTVLKRNLPEGEFTVSGSTKLVYMPDQLGSVRDVIDATTGTRVKSYDYTAYGKVARNNGASDTDYRYAGLWYHPQSTLNFAKYRAQDPATGRWVNRDPIRESGGLNLYGYADGNPVNGYDPIGYCANNPHDPNCDNLFTAFVMGCNGWGAAQPLEILLGVATGGEAWEAATAWRAAAAAEAAGAGTKAASTATRTTRSGETAIRETYPDGSVKDISPSRVKEYVPNTHPDAPPGTSQRVKYPDALPGSKGYKRAPTPEELGRLNNTK